MSSGPEALFRAALASGEVRLQHCLDCGATHYYPGIVCRACGSQKLEGRPASKRGIVYATTEIAGAPSRNVAIIELLEGPRVLATLRPHTLPIGTPVTAQIEEHAEEPRLVFST
jgi:uncharacterized OB-fold protein